MARTDNLKYALCVIAFSENRNPEPQGSCIWKEAVTVPRPVRGVGRVLSFPAPLRGFRERPDRRSFCFQGTLA